MAVDITIPSPGESITEVSLSGWLLADGTYVEKDDLLAEIESDKATLELRAPAAGMLKISTAKGDAIKVGAVVASIDTSTAKPATAPTASAAATHAAAATTTSDPFRASSVAKKVAAEKGVDLAHLAGSGPSGRVMKDDVLAATSKPAASTETKPVSVTASPSLASGPASGAAIPAGSRGVRREKMTRLRQKIAERLVHAQHSAAMLTTFNECDMTEVMRLRSEHKESFEKHHGVSLGFMSFFVKACCSALKRFPKVNAYISLDEVEYHDYADVSIAVGTDRGLVVPVLRNAELLSFAEIELAIRGFAAKAREGKLTVDEMTGGTFTITNGGIYGSLMSTPILNAPQSAILGMHTIKKRPVEDPRNPGQIALRPMMYLALSYDHRIIDGADAVSFLVHIKDCIEKPERLLLD